MVSESLLTLSRARESSKPAEGMHALDLRPGERPVLLPRIGLQIPPKFPYEGWLAIGTQLSGLASSSAWCLGDWLSYGEKTFSGRYREAIEQTSLDYQTLRNYAWVAKRFPMSRRRDTLSFGHHTEVAALPDPEQDYWLRKAEELSWSCKELRRELRVSLMERADAGRHGPENPAKGSRYSRVPGSRSNFPLSSWRHSMRPQKRPVLASMNGQSLCLSKRPPRRYIVLTATSQAPRPVADPKIRP